MVSKFLKWCKFKNLSAGTIRLYGKVLVNKLKVETKTHPQIIKIITDNNLAPATQILHKTIYMQYLKFNGEIPKLRQLNVIKLKKPDLIYRGVITKEQIKQGTELKPSDKKSLVFIKLLVRFLFETGCRYCEIKTIHEINGKLYVLGKGNKFRQLFYNLDTWKQLKVFDNKLKRISNSSLTENIKKLFGNEFSPHSLRRSFATHMLNNGANVKMVARQLGHSDVSTTYRYLQLSEDENFQIYNKFMLSA